jgi:hypothetical protein
VIDPKTKPSAENGLPECGHSWGGSNAAAALDEFTQEIRDVPEFHDCQRLVSGAQGQTQQYGPIAAVFARYRLDLVSFPEAPLADTGILNDVLSSDSLPRDGTPRVIKPVQAVPLAILYFPEGPPAAGHLTATSQLSCIYVAPLRGEAWVVPEDVDAESPCTTTSLKDLLGRPTLVVKRSYISNGDGAEIPAVARWDVTSDRGSPVIGLRCGKAWCEIGTEPFTPTASHAPADANNPALAVKGWYDEQQLAVFTRGAAPPVFGLNVDGEPGRRILMRPGENIGTVVPTPELDAWRSIEDKNGEWIPVARIYMRPNAGPYARELGFVGSSASPPDAPYATMSICRGTAKTCRPGIFRRFRATACGLADNPVAYYARIDTPGEASRYLCVKYRYHGQLAIHPPVVRWRWREDDETIWVRCPEGCCEGAAE